MGCWLLVNGLFIAVFTPGALIVALFNALLASAVAAAAVRLSADEAARDRGRRRRDDAEWLTGLRGVLSRGRRSSKGGMDRL